MFTDLVSGLAVNADLLPALGDTPLADILSELRVENAQGLDSVAVALTRVAPIAKE
jgi:hypothetical protein